jgi:hypothetical protein
MPKENDLEGVQDQGGKHGGQKGMPKPELRPSPRPGHGPEQVVRDEKGQEQPRDKAPRSKSAGRMPELKPVRAETAGWPS